ncbi:hypothetical protein [Ekhidna sp.]
MKVLSNYMLANLIFFMTSCLGKQEATVQQKPTSQMWELKKEDGWKVIKKVSFKYDEKGNRIEELSKSIDGDSESLLDRTIRIYDQNNNEVSFSREVWKDSTWSFAFDKNYLYEDKIIARRDSMVRGGSSSVFFVDYVYDKDDLLISEVSKRDMEGVKMNNSKVIYHYDKDGNPVIKEFPIWQNNQWGKSRKMILTYDSNGNHIQTIRYNWTDSMWVESIIYDLKVDIDGNRLEELWKRPDADSLKTYMRITYVFEN